MGPYKHPAETEWGSCCHLELPVELSVPEWVCSFPSTGIVCVGDKQQQPLLKLLHLLALVRDVIFLTPFLLCWFSLSPIQSRGASLTQDRSFWRRQGGPPLLSTILKQHMAVYQYNLHYNYDKKI